MSGEISSDQDAERFGVLRVQASFKVLDEQAAQAIAARLVDRAHEIANMPDCECDLDVSVEWTPPGGTPASVKPIAQRARGLPVDR